MSETRIGAIAITIEHPKEVQRQVNDLISDFGEIVIGRLGVPYRERQVAVLSLIVDGSENEINTLTGRLGSIPGVNAKAVMTKKI
ncbi:MAG TPA: TM1266 family iron-only hydrogenase system putative regulator [Bacillota bacterium]|nr:TM1266 family iron-only hydrogenase system putative regulator [Bacillota bacterium]